MATQLLYVFNNNHIHIEATGSFNIIDRAEMHYLLYIRDICLINHDIIICDTVSCRRGAQCMFFVIISVQSKNAVSTFQITHTEYFLVVLENS